MATYHNCIRLSMMETVACGFILMARKIISFTGTGIADKWESFRPDIVQPGTFPGVEVGIAIAKFKRPQGAVPKTSTRAKACVNLLPFCPGFGIVSDQQSAGTKDRYRFSIFNYLLLTCNQIRTTKHDKPEARFARPTVCTHSLVFSNWNSVVGS